MLFHGRHSYKIRILFDIQPLQCHFLSAHLIDRGGPRIRPGRRDDRQSATSPTPRVPHRFLILFILLFPPRPALHHSPLWGDTQGKLELTRGVLRIANAGLAGRIFGGAIWAKRRPGLQLRYQCAEFFFVGRQRGGRTFRRWTAIFCHHRFWAQGYISGTGKERSTVYDHGN